MVSGSAIRRPILASGEEEPGRGTRLIGAESLPRRSKPCRARASSPFEVALPDTPASFSSLVSSMPFDPRPIVVDYVVGPPLNCCPGFISHQERYAHAHWRRHAALSSRVPNPGY